MTASVACTSLVGDEPMQSDGSIDSGSERDAQTDADVVGGGGNDACASAAAADDRCAPHDGGDAESPDNDASDTGGEDASIDGEVDDSGADSGGGGPPREVTVLDIVAGGSHTCALLLDRTVECWGENGSGQLGDGTRNDRNRPVAVSGLTGVAMITAGNAHTCAGLQSGDVTCWGDNSSGQLGDGSTTTRLTPVTVALEELRAPSPENNGGVAEIYAGTAGTCMIAEERTKIWCWGDGQAQPREQYYPTGGYLDVVVGDDFGCVRFGTPRVCWGDGEPGTGLASLPLTNLAAGEAFVCAVTASNSVYCWGDNAKGQLGALDTEPKADGTLVANLGQVTALSAGQTHSCAALSGSGVACWGDNSFDQLGSATASLGAVTVSGISNALDVAAGGGHSCALLAGGSVSCWGSNASGQLGDGSNDSRAAPAPVVF